MTVTNTDSFKRHDGSSSTRYSFPFKVLSADDVDVYLDKVLQSSGYAITLENDGEDGGEVEFDTAPGTGVEVLIQRAMDQDQETEFHDGGSFPADNMNDAIDKLTMLVQELQRRINQCLNLGEASPPSGYTIPSPEALKYLRWNSDGDDFENGDPFPSLQALRYLQVNAAGNGLQWVAVLDTTPLPAAESSRYIGWNATGTALENKDLSDDMPSPVGSKLYMYHNC